MNVPTRLRNWDEFLETFGYTTEGFTSDAVYGYFQNGGTDCWINRVAHTPKEGAEAGPEHAHCAAHIQIDDWSKPSLKIRALNEGGWGNSIWFRCVHAPGA